MTSLLARTVAEAHLYMELNPCEVCGEQRFEPTAAVILVDGELCSRYTGECPQCGTIREFTFRLPDETPIPNEAEPSFGSGQPSELLDAGEWLWVADQIARRVPAEPDGMSADERWQAGLDVRTAAAAIAEARRFVPAGADAVPAGSLRSARGREVYAAEPGRFDVERLELVERVYRELAATFID
jgi:hypothetical protein